LTSRADPRYAQTHLWRHHSHWLQTNDINRQQKIAPFGNAAIIARNFLSSGDLHEHIER
jgi:hypothetical protein